MVIVKLSTKCMLIKRGKIGFHMFEYLILLSDLLFQDNITSSLARKVKIIDLLTIFLIIISQLNNNNSYF